MESFNNQGVGACVSIQFGALNYMKQLFANENRKMNIDTLSVSQLYLSGAASGVANSGNIELLTIFMMYIHDNDVILYP